MKKTILTILILIFAIVLLACNKTQQTEYIEKVSKINAMNTDFTISIYYQKEEEAKAVEDLMEELEVMIVNINKLTDNFLKYENINNISYINENPNIKIEIDETLYDIILLAEQYRVEFNGYFDISVGLIIDEWKKLINLDDEIFKKDENNNVIPLTEEEFNDFVNNVNKIPIIENGITLAIENNKHYITIKEGVKLDLGAIAKGYVVEKINNTIKEANIKFYKIKGSESSLEFGENPNRDGNIFRVGIRNATGIGYEEIVEVKNKGITTSGDTVQYYLHNGVKYHHIISPITKKPENNRSLVTIIGDGATKLDAMTTALMSMPEEVFNQFIEKYPQYKIYNIK
ncbi:MAG TPA: FAD:protein FMN transferase [Acholeplasmataceae bacterium]|nr:FAD:protein FMN transferase [Acholeplasmataceae bacterium]